MKCNVASYSKHEGCDTHAWTSSDYRNATWLQTACYIIEAFVAGWNTLSCSTLSMNLLQGPKRLSYAFSQGGFYVEILRCFCFMQSESTVKQAVARFTKRNHIVEPFFAKVLVRTVVNLNSVWTAT